MVGSVFLLLLLCSIAGVRGEDSYETFDRLTLENNLLSSAQIHYQYCDTRFNCIIPSKYFKRVKEKSLHVTTETRIPFMDGLEIHVMNKTVWHLTLMANNSDSTIVFTWGNWTMMTCNDTTEIDDEQFNTPFTTLTVINRTTSYIDDNGEYSDGLICKYKLERRDNYTETTMPLIFGELVNQSINKTMCFNVTGVVNESYCSPIEELKPTMRLTYNPIDCTKCKVAKEVCIFEKTVTNCRDEKMSPLLRRPHTNCEYFHSYNWLLVNDKFYVKKGDEIRCQQGRWVMKRFKPQIDWDRPNEATEEVFLPKIKSIFETETLDCSIASPLKSVCRRGGECERITDFRRPYITCKNPEQPLSYYRNNKKGKSDSRKLHSIQCNQTTGIWNGYPDETSDETTAETPAEYDLLKENVTHSPMVYTLRTGDSVVCESSEFDQAMSHDDDDLKFDADVEDDKAEPRRDDPIDYTNAIIVCTVVLVASAILLILGVLAVASCLGTMRKPVGLHKSERSHAPISAAGESEMSFSDRVSFLFT